MDVCFFVLRKTKFEYLPFRFSYTHPCLYVVEVNLLPMQDAGNYCFFIMLLLLLIWKVGEHKVLWEQYLTFRNSVFTTVTGSEHAYF